MTKLFSLIALANLAAVIGFAAPPCLVAAGLPWANITDSAQLEAQQQLGAICGATRGTMYVDDVDVLWTRGLEISPRGLSLDARVTARCGEGAVESTLVVYL